MPLGAMPKHREVCQTQRVFKYTSPESYQPRGGPLTSGFSRAVHRDFDGSVVSSDLRWVCEDSDGEGEALAWEDTNRTG